MADYNYTMLAVFTFGTSILFCGTIYLYYKLMVISSVNLLIIIENRYLPSNLLRINYNLKPVIIIIIIILFMSITSLKCTRVLHWYWVYNCTVYTTLSIKKSPSRIYPITLSDKINDLYAIDNTTILYEYDEIHCDNNNNIIINSLTAVVDGHL